MRRCAISGETEKDISGWTTDTLHLHLSRRIDELERRLEERFAQQQRAIDEAFAAHEKLTNVQIAAAAKAVDAALAAAKEAVDKAEIANDKRFDAVNEFRGQLNDQAALFLPRTEYDARHTNLEDRVTDLTNRLNRAEGVKTGGNEQRSAIYAFVGFLATALVLVTVLAANGVFSR